MAEDWGQNDQVVSGDNDWGQNDKAVEDAQTAAPDNSVSNKATRVGLGMLEPLAGGFQLGAHAIGYGTETADNFANWIAEKEAQKKAAAGLTDKDWDYYSGAGNILSPVNAIPGGAAAKVAGIGAKTLLGAAGRGALAGAAYSASQPVNNSQGDYWSQKGIQTGTGALAGAALGPATQVAGRIIKPAIDANAQKLLDEGVPLTAGQTAGPTFKRLEDIAAKTPFFGGSVREAQERALGGFNTAAANRALEPIGEKIPTGVKPGHDLFNYTEGKLSDAYDATHANMSAKADNQFASALTQTMAAAPKSMADSRVKQLQAIVDDINDRFVNNNGTLNGGQIQDIASQLKKQIRDYRFSSDADQRNLAGSLNDVRESFENMLMRQNPAEAPVLKGINKGWAYLMRLERATGSSASGAREGAFTPTRLLQADTQLSGRRGSARGNGMYQDIAEAGKTLLNGSVSDSGTPERFMTHGAVAGIASGHINPLSIIPGLALPLLYSETGQSAIRAALTKRPAGADAISNVLRQYGPVAPVSQLLGKNQ